jgi:hypothetical protein
VIEQEAASKGWIRYRGAIDNPDIRDQAKKLLEGGELAIRRRLAMYGIEAKPV